MSGTKHDESTSSTRKDCEKTMVSLLFVLNQLVHHPFPMCSRKINIEKVTSPYVYGLAPRAPMISSFSCNLVPCYL